jgi:hypothetical protein
VKGGRVASRRNDGVVEAKFGLGYPAREAKGEGMKAPNDKQEMFLAQAQPSEGSETTGRSVWCGVCMVWLASGLRLPQTCRG